MLCYSIKALSTGCSAGGSAPDWGSGGRKFKSCHSDQEKQDTDWYPAFFMQSARLELANEFPNSKPVRRGCLGETSGGVSQCSFTPAMIFFTLISLSFIIRTPK